MGVAWEAVIGLEIHVELLTRTKMFCSCPTSFGSQPNTQVCPVCLGMPGVLPVANRRAVEMLLATALALECTIPETCKFDRKNYFYPDMPKNYQISQYDLPLARNGRLVIGESGEGKKIRIHRIHLEEDTGKTIHTGPIDRSDFTLLDYNRAGVPLMEIVTEPDIGSPQEAHEFLRDLRDIVGYLEVSDCKMEEGSLRCDANVSVRRSGSETLGTRTEVKNMNSFKSVQRALQHEIERQIELVERGERVVQETRGWDEAQQVTIPMRSKEEAHDYRYFPDPDLVPLEVSREWVQEIASTLPELPGAKRERFSRVYGIPEYDARVLTCNKEMALFFEETVALYPNPKTVSNWLMGDVSKYLNANNIAMKDLKIPPRLLSEMLALVDSGVLSGKLAKTVLEEMLRTGKSAPVLVKEKGLEQITDTEALEKVIREVMSEHETLVEEYLQGKEKAFKFLIGQVMQKTSGKASPKLVNELLMENLKNEAPAQK
ncbi:MAG: Asp-tRNA(Asn)/Glu-tRNA(Gln) amidotransferase subunit GatB [Armatimonadetes bacterium]|nr:Asp-tRNA(Asn)/Glu-tRNA(Gln) amidotransferase subunit GatB [Armatimonadota bacterium]